MLGCPLCGVTCALPVFRKNEFFYYRCPECQSLFVDLKMGDVAVYEYYGEDYYESKNLPKQGRGGYPSYRASYATLTDGFRKKLDFIRRYVPEGKLLDAGAAYGFFLKAAESHFQGDGIDVSPYAAMIAQRDFNAHVKVGNVESLDVPDRSYDVVVMWDILEHVIRPIKALTEVARVLKPGGYLFVSTDDAANWLPRTLGKFWWSLGPPMHLCHLSKRGLTVACQRAGLDSPAFFPDPREYTLPEIVKHFGVSYGSNFLKGVGLTLEKTVMKKILIRIARPEQFVAVIQKKFER